MRQGIRNTTSSIFFWQILALESDTYYRIRADYLYKARCSNPNKLIVTHIDINSLQNNLEMFKVIIENNIDI